MTIPLTIIVPTKNRCKSVKELLDSLKALRGLSDVRPEVIIGDNASTDQTWEILQKEANGFPIPLRLIKVTRLGKSAALNEAMHIATGEILAFLDDDVIVDQGWLEAMQRFFRGSGQAVGQGTIRIPPSESDDPELQDLLQRYRTIPKFEYHGTGELHSLNGANIVIRRDVFDRVGPFDERLGPGASGTSEDVELAQRILRAGMKIGYMKEAVVYHRIDRSRLTEDYFRTVHKQQGHSRILMNDRGIGRVFFDLGRASAQFAFYSLGRSERDRYRSKGRIYHYLGMLEAKLKNRHGSVAAILP